MGNQFQKQAYYLGDFLVGIKFITAVQLPTVMRRRFTLTQSSLEDDFAKMKMNDAHKKTDDLQEENSKLREEIKKLGEAVTEKDNELIELRTTFSEGLGLPCPKCLGLTGTPGSEDEILTPDKGRLVVLQQKLEESESKLETTVKELARVQIHLASSGIIFPSRVNVSSETPTELEEEISSDNEADQHSSSASSLQGERTASTAGSHLAEIVITEPSPCVGDSMEEAEDSQSIKTQSSRKGKRKKSKRKDNSVKQTARRSAHPNQASGEDENQENERDTREDADDYVMQKRNAMENKAVQTVHRDSAFGRSPFQRDAGSRADAIEHFDDLRDEMALFASGKMDLETGWKAKLHKLCNNIEEILDDSETGVDQLETVLSAAITREESDDIEDYPRDFRPVGEQLTQNMSRKRKSIFMRLVDNNIQKRGSIMPNVNKVHDRLGRHSRSKSVYTPQCMNIMEEPDINAPLHRLPAISSHHFVKHAELETLVALQSKEETQTPKLTLPKKTGTPIKTKKSSHEMQYSENQVGESGKKMAGILKHTPPKHSELHTHPVHASNVPSHPKDNMKGKVRKQSLAFGGDEEVNAPYSKPFRVRRRSIFGHTDVLEKLASTTALEHSGLSEESKLVDGVPYHDQESDRYYDGEKEEYRRTITRGKSGEYATKTPTTPERGFDHDAQQMRYRKMSRGNFRPSMHPFIGLSEEDRASLTNIYNTRQSIGGLFGRMMPDNDEEESEIEVGALNMNNFSKDSLRKAFLSLGLMHLKGYGDDVRAEERLTMEDQVNIVAQTAMEVLRATCDVFAKSRRELQSIPDQQSKISDDDNEVAESRSREAIFPPLNTPENKLFFEDKPTDSTGEQNKEISLPELPKHAVTPEAETTNSIVNRNKRDSLMRRPRQGAEERPRDILARYAAKRRSVNRSHPFRNMNNRKTVMERILGSNMAAFGNILANEPRLGGMRSQRNSLSRRPFMDNDGEEFSLTAQAIKLPGQSAQTTGMPLISQPAAKLTPQGMPKSPSVGAQGLSASGRVKYPPAISKAKSDVTHNRLFIGAGGQETARWPAGRGRQPSTRKKF